MRLISCHVENFGKLSDYTLEFKPGENIILQENGWGKSTFAAFIRAMFYGLSGARKQNLEENERKKYKPWQGGVFGGQLTFECRNKRYTVSRIFREREGQDEFELRDADTNLISRDYTERLGEEIFKLNRESFLRSVFISQADCETAVTDDIHARVGNLTDRVNDMDNYQRAADALAALQNQLSPTRKTGAIYRKEEEAAALYRGITEKKELKQELWKKQEDLKETEDRIGEIKIRETDLLKTEEELVKKEALKAEKEARSRILTRIKEKEAILKKAGDAFPKEVPAMEEIGDILVLMQDAEKKDAKASVYELTAEEKESLSQLRNCYHRGFPDEASLKRAEEFCEEYVSLEERIRGKGLSKEEEEELNILEYRFSGISEDPREMRNLYEERRARRDLLERRKKILNETEDAKSENDRDLLSPALFTVGSILFIAGIVLLFTGHEILGAAGLTAAVALVMMGLIIIKVRKDRGNEDREEELIREIRIDIGNIEQADMRLKNFLMSHDISLQEEAIPGALEELIRENDRMKQLKSRKNDPLLEKDMKRKEKVETALRQYLAIYQPEADSYNSREAFQKGVRQIEKDRTLYLNLSEKQKKKRENEAQAKEALQRIFEFLNDYGFTISEDPMKQLLQIRDRADDWYDARRDLTDTEWELRRFDETHEPFSSETAEEEASEDVKSREEVKKEREEIRNLLEDLQERRYDLKDEISRLSKADRKLQEDEETLRLLRRSLEKDKKRYKTAALAGEYLEKAREVIINRYAEPLLRSFSEFYGRITGEEAESYHMDASLEMTTEEKGLQRPTEALSSGYRDLVGICLRVALVEAMYREEKPFMIMDDPFTNLDDEKTRRSREFIRKLSEDYQIIYLTCSSYRS